MPAAAVGANSPVITPPSSYTPAAGSVMTAAATPGGGGCVTAPQPPPSLGESISVLIKKDMRHRKVATMLYSAVSCYFSI